jgi:Tfp pilus assembly protein FimV
MLYRGSLPALLIATSLALWLLLKPAGNEEQSTPNIVVPTATPQATRTTPTTGLTVTPAGTVTAAATATPSQLEYTVQEGDSLFDIAALFLPADESLTDFAVRIANANGLDPNDPILRPGDTLIIPQ